MDHPEFHTTPHATLVGSLTGHRGLVTAMAWSPDGKWLASTSVDGVLNLWERIRSTTGPRFTRESDVAPVPTLTSVAWSPDGQFVACGSTAGRLAVWETSGYRRVSPDERGAKSAIHCVAWGAGPGPGDRRLAFGDEDHVVHFRNYRNWAKPDSERGVGHESSILALAWSPDGRAVVTGTRDGTIGVWTPSPRHNELRVLLTWRGIRAHEDQVNTLAFCAKTGMLASGGRDGRVVLWDVVNEALVEELAVEEDEEVLDLEFGHNGEIIVVQTLDHLRFLRRDPLRARSPTSGSAACIPPAGSSGSTISIVAGTSLAWWGRSTPHVSRRPGGRIRRARRRYGPTACSRSYQYDSSGRFAVVLAQDPAVLPGHYTVSPLTRRRVPSYRYTRPVSFQRDFGSL